MLATDQWVPPGRSPLHRDDIMAQDVGYPEEVDSEVGVAGAVRGGGSDDDDIDIGFDDCFELLGQPPEPKLNDAFRQMSDTSLANDPSWSFESIGDGNHPTETPQLREVVDFTEPHFEQLNFNFEIKNVNDDRRMVNDDDKALRGVLPTRNRETIHRRGVESGSDMLPIKLSSQVDYLTHSHNQDTSLSKQPQGQSRQSGGITPPNSREVDLILPAHSTDVEFIADNQNYHPSLILHHDQASWRSLGVCLGEPGWDHFPVVINEVLNVTDAAGSGEPRNSSEAYGSFDRTGLSRWGGLGIDSGVSCVGSGHEVESAETSMCSGESRQGYTSAQSNVVDLTEDSDDETTVRVPQPDRIVLSVKRKAENPAEKLINRRLNIFKENVANSGRESSSYGYHVSRSGDTFPGQISDGSSGYPPMWGSAITQDPQLWKPVGSSHIPSRQCPVPAVADNAIVHSDSKRGAQFSSGALETSADRSSTVMLKMQDDSSTTAMQISSEGSEISGSLPIKMVTGTSPCQRPLSGGNLMEADVDPLHMSVTLLRHQKMALYWMKKRELEGVPPGGILADDQGLGKTVSTISLIMTLRSPIQKKIPSEAASVSHRESLTVDLEDDDESSQCVQVISSVGTGDQTIRTPATTSKEVGSDTQNTSADVKAGVNKPRTAAGTLIVCPTSVLRQWALELKEKVTEEAKLSVLIYHGSNRAKNPDELAKYDVVLTTYAIVSMEVPKQPLPDEKDAEKRLTVGNDHDPSTFRPPFKPQKKAAENEKKGKSKGAGKGRLGDSDHASVDSGPLARLNWFRVVLDEAQSIKNSRTQVARAAWGLRAKRRWCLSGTPIQNTIDDLYSYFRFLRFSPYDSYKEFRERLKDPVSKNPASGYKELQRCLSQVMIRRTKETVINGIPIVNLPPRIVVLKRAEFSEEERNFYNTLEAESRKQFQDYAEAGTLQSNYVNILWMLLRLRQACDHPLLVKGQKSEGANGPPVDLPKTIPLEKRRHLLSLLEANRDICLICSDIPDEPTICICTHIFCRQCILERLATGDDLGCPAPKCKKSLNPSLVFTLASLSNHEHGGESHGGKSPFLQPKKECKIREDVIWKSSSKINAVIDTLSALPRVFVDIVSGKVVEQVSEDEAAATELSTHPNKQMAKVQTSCHNGKGPQTATKGNSVFSSEGEEPKDYSPKGISKTLDPNTRGLLEKVECREEGNLPVVSGVEIVIGCHTAAVQEVKLDNAAADIVSLPQPPKRELKKSTEKAIVFSQWTSMLDLLEVKLKEAKFNYRRLDGTMSVSARDKAALEFKTLPEVTVIIMSLKAASLGLNMVAACHVLLLDVWWNPTAEDQAIDRAHRIGQTRTVTVSRFTVKDTIEDRILALQEKKRRMVASAFGEKAGESNKTGLSANDFHYLFDV